MIFFRSNYVVEWKEKHRRQLIHLVDKNAVLDCTIVKFYIKELNDCLTSIEDVTFGLARQFRSSLSCDNFCPVSRIVAPRADMQIENQTDPPKTGLVRCLVSKSHGSEVCNCCVQRVFFSLSAGSRNRGLSQLRYEKKTLWHSGYFWTLLR